LAENTQEFVEENHFASIWPPGVYNTGDIGQNVSSRRYPEFVESHIKMHQHYLLTHPHYLLDIEGQSRNSNGMKSGE
jgi:hypothetical protein